MAKRANGEGSIHKRRDGRWAASISVGRGKRKHFLGKDREDVAIKLRAALTSRDDGLPVIIERQTVGKFLKSWLDVTRPTLRERTWIRYEQYVRLHVVPSLGNTALTKLTPSTYSGCTPTGSPRGRHRPLCTTCTPRSIAR